MKKIALVNMPFGSIYRPSIGLSLLKSALSKDGHGVDIHYLNLPFASRVGLERYNTLTNIPSALLGEWVFARALNGGNSGDDAFFAGFVTPEQQALKRDCLEIRDAADRFVEDCAELDWGAYDLVGFTSVFEQTTASLALAARIKARHPQLLIAFGGPNAEGEMGLTLLRAYPWIDVVCSGEGDIAFPQYVAGLEQGRDEPIRGILRQGADAAPSSTASVRDMDALPLPDYGDYFAQFLREPYGATEAGKAEILFESSRGCWWGEKSHCKFCGLNGSNMAFRSKSSDRILGELNTLKARYGGHTERFFAVDNIIDYKYFRDLLPILRDTDSDYDLFYETKANLSREQVRLLRDSNIRRIQPGIESLSSAILKLMGKGVSALQNIQLLKLCKEFGVLPVWNIIYGFPGEDPAEYGRLADLVPALSHLEPPSGWYRVRLDRFSPYFNQSDEHGIVNVRPFPQYALVHTALSEDQLAGVAYYFDFDYADGRSPEVYVQPFAEQLGLWMDRNRRGYLFYEVIDDRAYLFDFRDAFPKGLVVLSAGDRCLYELLDRPSTPRMLQKALADLGWPGDEEALRSKLQRLVARGLVMEENDRYLALAIRLGDYQPPPAVLNAFSSAVSRARAREMALA